MHLRVLSWLFVAALSLGFQSVGTLFAGEIPPLGKGAYEVGSTNMEVKEHPALPMIDYLKGKSLEGHSAVSVVDIYAQPDAALSMQVKVPDNRKVYGEHAGKTIPVGLYVCYPTTRNNPRVAYTFPYKDTGDNVFPHMQKAGDKPLFAEPGKRYPLIVYSTGYEGHGLWDLVHMKALASHGYIVLNIAHADGRFALPDNFALRPLELTKAIDALLANPDFASAIDPEKIGVSGSSFGGYTILAAMGGKYLRSMDTSADPRIKAGFGLVPFSGGVIRWPFGKDWAGLTPVKTPYLAVYGEIDQNVPPETVLGSIARTSGTASAVMLEKEVHLLSNKVWDDVYTWEVLFFNAWLKGDEAAGRLIYQNESVLGGAADHKTFQRLVTKPWKE